jgi:tetratricopeptide (TPR) repeat protein
MPAHRVELAAQRVRNQKTPAAGIRRPAAPMPASHTPARASDSGPRRRITQTFDEADPTTFEVEKLLAAAGAGAREMAITRLTELHEQHPDHPRVSRALGMLLFNEKRFEEACAALDDAIVADPLAFDLYFYLGWLYLALNEVEEARHALRRALFLEPGFTFARYELALTLHRAGQFDEAVREYARAEQAVSDPRVNQRLREHAEGSSETFWINDSFIVELCRSNKERARQRLTPQTSARIMGAKSL